MFDDIIVPLDGSRVAARALGPACALGRYLDIEVRVVAYHLDGDRPVLAATIDGQMSGFGGVVRSLLLEPLRMTVGIQLGDLLAESAHSLLCMSTTGRGRAVGLAGRVASDVLRHAEGPVLLVGPSCEVASFRCDGPLVVAIDGTEHAPAIVAVAEAFATEFEFELRVVTVGDSPGLATLEPGPAGPVDQRVLHHHDPATALVDLASGIDAALLAMSALDPGGGRRPILGTTTAAVVHRSGCPVLTVR